MNILVTGGAGYIGSHTCVELCKAGYETVICDNFDNSNPKVLERLQAILPVAQMQRSQIKQRLGGREKPMGSVSLQLLPATPKSPLDLPPQRKIVMRKQLQQLQSIRNSRLGRR